MASSKRIGFFLGEEKITVVECDKNTPLQVDSSSMTSKTSALSPFSSNLTEEIQITAILQKMLQDHRITGGSFYVSLPLKEIILRSFIIPFVQKEDIQNVIKFEAKKYMPFDIQDLTFVFHTIPFAEGQKKRLQVIFFAVRKEVSARYERIFKQVNAEVSLCEPYMVSLAKALLFKKEIKATDHIAFLILDKNLGRICFIDKGIPQFIREFSVSSPNQSEDSNESQEDLNLKIVNEVGNSFDFYARQFNGERIVQMLVASDFAQKELLDTLEVELKVSLRKFSPIVITGQTSQANDMDAIYAMGACVIPPLETLSVFNFLGDKTPKSGAGDDLLAFLGPYKEVLLVLLVCVASLAGTYVYFQSQMKSVQKKMDQLALQGGASLNEPIEGIQSETQSNTDLLNQYKSIQLKSDVAFILLRVASHLPQGAVLSQLNVAYDQTIDPNNPNKPHVTITMAGDVFKDDPNEEVKVVNQIYSDFKNDKELARFIKTVSISLNLEESNNQQVTGFKINCS